MSFQGHSNFKVKRGKQEEILVVNALVVLCVKRHDTKCRRCCVVFLCLLSFLLELTMRFVDRMYHEEVLFSAYIIEALYHNYGSATCTQRFSQSKSLWSYTSTVELPMSCRCVITVHATSFEFVSNWLCMLCAFHLGVWKGNSFLHFVCRTGTLSLCLEMCQFGVNTFISTTGYNRHRDTLRYPTLPWTYPVSRFPYSLTKWKHAWQIGLRRLKLLWSHWSVSDPSRYYKLCSLLRVKRAIAHVSRISHDVS